MNNNFCVLPFYGAEYSLQNQPTPCCLLPDNTNILVLRTEMLNGIKPSACKRCWDLEEQGITSDRQLKNSAFDYYKDRDINFIEQDCRDGNYSTQIVKFYTSNICNSTCVTCNAHLSSAWATLTNKKTFSIIDNTVLDALNYSDMVILTFVGGEPFYEKKNFDILERLIKAGNTNCFISFTTNGSTMLSDYQKSILGKFKNLNICLSIDGVGPVFEYMRYPLKWDNLLSNIDFFRKNNIQLSVSYTISNLNILYYTETVNWFNQQQLQHNHILVKNPSYFSPSALPDHIKSNLPIAVTNTADDELNFNLACKEIRNQDNLKKISIKDYMPEFYNIIPTNLR